jgi:hypothetical protein
MPTTTAVASAHFNAVVRRCRRALPQPGCAPECRQVAPNFIIFMPGLLII